MTFSLLMFPAHQFWPPNRPGNEDSAAAVQLLPLKTMTRDMDCVRALRMAITCSPVSEVLGRASMVTGSSRLTVLQSAQTEAVPEVHKSQPPAKPLCP